jgi:hypothetical protein
MAKSNRQRKHDRALRQAKAARKQSAAQQRQLLETLAQKAAEREERMYDPATPVVELAGLLLVQFGGSPVLPVLPDLLISKGSSAGRLVEVSEVMRADETAQFEPVEDGGAYRLSLTCLTFSAAAAHAAGDATRARELIDEALRYAYDPEEQLRVAMHLGAHGRIADALDVIEELLRDDPGDDQAARVYGAAIEEAFGRSATDEPPSGCPCGSGGSWRDCCAPRERAAIERFGDQSGLVALQDAVAAYLTRSGYGRAVAAEVSQWRSLTETEGWTPGERKPFLALAQELALATVMVSPEGQAGEDNALGAFAADPATPPELAAQARAWRGHIHYGLWQIAEPNSAPGLWCTDIVTGTQRYVAFPDEMADQFPRWGVLLGGVLPVDGVWRATGQAVRLSPSEADALAETIADATDRVVRNMAGKPVKRAPRAVPFGHAEPYNVFAYQAEGLPAEAVQLTSMIVASLLLRLAGEVHDYRATSAAQALPLPELGREKAWLDEQLPALNGQTPRQAAADPEDQALLEALLRQFEYEGTDATWLRDELDLPASTLVDHAGA